MIKRIFFLHFLWIMVPATGSIHVSSHGLTNTTPPEHIRKNLITQLDTYTNLPTVVSEMILHYLAIPKWVMTSTLNPYNKGAQHVFCGKTTALSAYHDEVTFWNINNNSADTRMLAMTPDLYTKTYLLRSGNTTYAVVSRHAKHAGSDSGDDESGLHEQDITITIYRLDKNGEDLKCNEYSNTRFFALSPTMWGGVMRKTKRIYLFNSATEKFSSIKTTLHKPTLLAFSPNGTRLLVGNDHGLCEKWNTQNKERIKAFNLSIKATAIALSNEGRIAIAWDTYLALYNGREPLSLETNGNISTLCYSPDGSILLALNYTLNKNVIERRDGYSGKVIQLLASNPQPTSRGPVSGVGFAIGPDSDKIVTNYLDGTLALWQKVPSNEYDINLSGASIR